MLTHALVGPKCPEAYTHDFDLMCGVFTLGSTLKSIGYNEVVWWSVDSSEIHHRKQQYNNLI